MQSFYFLPLLLLPYNVFSMEDTAQKLDEAVGPQPEVLHQQIMPRTAQEQGVADQRQAQQQAEEQRLAVLRAEEHRTKNYNSGITYNPAFYYPTADLINYGKRYANPQTEQMIERLTSSLPWTGPNHQYQAWPAGIANHIKENYATVGGKMTPKGWGNGELVTEYYNNFILRMNQNVQPW